MRFYFVLFSVLALAAIHFSGDVTAWQPPRPGNETDAA